MESILNNIKQILERQNIINQNSYPINLDLKIEYSQFGGSDAEDIINTICLTTGFQTKTKLVGKIGNTVKTFQFIDNIKPLGNCAYYAKGSYSAVYIVKENINQLILRVTKKQDFQLDKYNKDKSLGIEVNLPAYLYYGQLFSGNVRYYYTITRKYNTFDGVGTLNMSPANKLLFFDKLLHLMAKLETNNYLINDFKPQNMGYDENYNPVILDYDGDTVSQTVGRLQTFWCHTYYPTEYDGVKQTYNAFVYFMLTLFTNEDGLNPPWRDSSIGSKAPRCFIKDFGRIRDRLNKMIFYVNDPFKKYIQDIILYTNNNGLLGNTKPTYNQILMLFNATKKSFA